MATRQNKLLRFFFVVFVFSLPFWLIGHVTGLELSPGLPISALMSLCPTMAASMLLYWEHDADAVIRLLKRSLDYERIKAKTWYMAIIFVMPCATLLSYGIMRFMGFPLTIPVSCFLWL